MQAGHVVEMESGIAKQGLLLLECLLNSVMLMVGH